VEHKHRHIMEVGLCLLAHASMPLKYWDETFLTTVFLINRLPSKVIAHATPHERLLDSPLDYSFLRTFGCAVWQNLRPYNAKKVQFRSKRYVFLGYSNLHKGFKCLDPSTGRIYVSRDVVFDETLYPFAQLHPNVGARLRVEFALLPDILQNPSSKFGDAKIGDQNVIDSNPANVVPSTASVVDETGENPVENHEETTRPGGHFMFPSATPRQDNGGTGPGGDQPATPTPRTESAAGLASGVRLSPPPHGGACAPGSSTPSASAQLSLSASSSATADPSPGALSPLAANFVSSGIRCGRCACAFSYV
jgi:hypothetical protein